VQLTIQVDKLRQEINTSIDKKKRAKQGQYFTPMPVAVFMASLFEKMEGDIQLLDPGCGLGSLTAAFIDESLRRSKLQKLDIIAYDNDHSMSQHINSSLKLFQEQLEAQNIPIQSKFLNDDFVLEMSKKVGNGHPPLFSHVIMNPPYKKIKSKGEHRKAMSYAGIETVNLYSGFMALALDLLKEGGELVAIIPRSFCNGPYYKAFREKILNDSSIQRIHVFDSRTDAFSDDGVLQENIIIHLIKGKKQGKVLVSSSPDAQFYESEEDGRIQHDQQLLRDLDFDRIVQLEDEEKFIYIAPTEKDQLIFDKMKNFKTRLKDLELEVSTGPVVDFRLKKDLLENIEEGAVPLLYPIHLNGKVNWPKVSKKPNAIKISADSKRWLWKNEDCFVLVRRFSSKEEKRRIHASLYDGGLKSDYIGFENKLNVFNYKKNGLDKAIALGLFVYLNSSLLDAFFRLFSGHTQVNATDLRNIPYPNKEQLLALGAGANTTLTQNEIDQRIEELL